MTTRDEYFIDLPGIDWEGVQRTLRERVFPAYLEYRTAFDEFDAFLGKSKPFWELRCSGCGETFAMEKAKDLHVSRLEFCPRCGKPVKAIRWRDRTKRMSQVLVKILLRGADRKVWMRCWRIELMIGGDGAALSGYEKARFLFEDGAANKWKTEWDREADDCRWVKKRRLTHENWNTNLYGYAMYAPEVYLDGCAIMEENEEPDYSGTCIEYSAFDRLLSYRSDSDIVTGPIEEYLALYCKHPIVEYLVKGDLTSWIEQYLYGRCRAEFGRLVNLRAKKPKKLLKKLTMAEAKLLKNYKISVAAAYARLKDEGVIRETSEEAVRYTRAAGENWNRYEYILRGSGGDGKRLRSYLERQAKKGNVSISVAMGDYRDYLRENLDELGIAPGGFDVFPHDLLAAHARLTSRLKRKAKNELRPEFRMRRRRLRPVRWVHGGLFIRPVDSPLEMVREGEQQEHCVARYQSGHAEGKSYILLLRDREAPKAPLYTVEWNAKENRVIQCRGRGNRPLQPEIEERKNRFLEAWVARNDRLRTEGKLKDAI